MKVFLKGLGGDTTTLDVEPSNTIEQVKEMLKSPVPVHLLFNSKRLDDSSKTLEDYGVHDEATLHLLPAPAAPAVDPCESPAELLEAAEEGNTSRVASTVETPEGSVWLLSARDEDGNVPLGVACWEGHVECVRVILATVEGRQSASCQDNCGNTPLNHAAWEGHPEIVTAILGEQEGVASVNVQNQF